LAFRFEDEFGYGFGWEGIYKHCIDDQGSERISRLVGEAEDASESRQPCDQAAEILSDGGEDGVGSASPARPAR